MARKGGRGRQGGKIALMQSSLDLETRFSPRMLVLSSPPPLEAQAAAAARGDTAPEAADAGGAGGDGGAAGDDLGLFSPRRLVCTLGRSPTRTLSPQRKPANKVKALAASLGAQFVPGGFLPSKGATSPPRMPDGCRIFGDGCSDPVNENRLNAQPSRHLDRIEAARTPDVLEPISLNRARRTTRRPKGRGQARSVHLETSVGEEGEDR